MNKNIENYLDLENLSKKYNLSNRTINVLSSAFLFNEKDIFEYFKKYKTFKNIKNAGEITENEILNLLLNSQFADDVKQIAPLKKNNIVSISSNQFDFTQKLKFNVKEDDPDYFLKKYIFHTIYEMNERISKVLNDKLSDLSILDYLNFFENFDIKKIRGVGVSKSYQFELFIGHLKFIIQKALKNTNYLKSFEFLPDVLNYYTNGKYNINQIINDCLDENKQMIYFFRLINNLLETNFFGDEGDINILKNRESIFNSISKKPMHIISKDFNLTSERIRQLSIEIENKFWNKIELLEFIIGRDRIIYKDYLEFNNGIIDIDSIALNKIEKNDFTFDFIYKIFYFILKDKYQPISVSRKNVKKNFLVDFKFKDINFQELIDNIERIVETSPIFKIKFNIEEFLKSQNLTYEGSLKDLKDLLYELVKTTFNAIPESNGNLILERSYKYMYEYAYEILYEEGKPMTLQQLFKKIESRYPGIVKNIEALRGNMQSSDKFIYFGRSSTYGLKEWEVKGLFKGGTIKQIVEEFLNILDRPAHISEITEYVNKYRKTNEFNVMGNLKFDNNNKFEFFNSGFVGLKYKKYDPKDTKYNKLNLNLFRRTYLRMFSNNVSKLSLDEFTEELAKKNKVSEIQIRSIINKKLKNGKLFINQDGFIEKRN